MSSNDNELFARLAKIAQQMPADIRPKRYSAAGVQAFYRELRAIKALADANPDSGSETTRPDLSISYRELPCRVQFSLHGILHGHISEELIARYESGDYPTLEDHLARRTPASRPYLSLADEILRRNT